MTRKDAAKRLGNPRLNSISFRTLRHFKATMEYHRTKDILHVIQLLGHKSIKNTLVYTHLVDFGGDEFVCKVARSVDDAKELVESGFDYVTEIDDVQLFRKRK
jgi:site-specific recombinase XerC